MKKCLYIIAFLSFSIVAYSQDAWVSFGGGIDSTTPNPIWPYASAGFFIDIEQFRLFFILEGLADGYMGGYHDGAVGALAMNVKEAGVLFEYGAVEAGLGWFPLRDRIGSPYSLILSGKENASLNLNFEIESGWLFFNSRWIALNWDSIERVFDVPANNYPWPDRSANVRTISLTFGRFEFGLQDAVVYSDVPEGSFDAAYANARGPAFDLAYFLIPLPSFFTQIVFSMEDATTKRTYNDNGLIGLFINWDGDDADAYAQLLIDDINLNRFIDPEGSQNPDKIAWSVGFSFDTDWGLFGIFHAGATKYMFQPFGGPGFNGEYGYVFVPDALFDRNGASAAIDTERNYLGYYHGENNLAFLISWEGDIAGIPMNAALEFTLSGSKSPANPWNELVSWNDGPAGTRMLDDPVLEKKLTFSYSTIIDFQAWALSLSLSAGYVWNMLQAVAPIGSETDSRVNGLWFYAPSATETAFGSISLEVVIPLLASVQTGTIE
jgi:hypothetical protein